jgi:hypothetical protein
MCSITLRKVLSKLMSHYIAHYQTIAVPTMRCAWESQSAHTKHRSRFSTS